MLLSRKLVGALSGILALFLTGVALMIPAMPSLDMEPGTVSAPQGTHICPVDIDVTLGASPVDVLPSGELNSIEVGPFPEECINTPFEVAFIGFEGSPLGFVTGEVNELYTIVGVMEPIHVDSIADVIITIVND